MERVALGRGTIRAHARKRPWRPAIQGVVLLLVAVLCIVVALGGVFDDEPALDGAASSAGGNGGAVNGGDANPAADAPATAGPTPTDGAAPSGEATAPAEAAIAPAEAGGALPADTAAVGPDVQTDPLCVPASEAWAQSAKAQVDVSLAHPRSVVTGFTTAREALASVEPPDAVVEDWTLVRNYVTEIADAVEETGTDDPVRLGKAIDSVGDDIDTAALTAASGRVTSYFQDGCTG